MTVPAGSTGPMAITPPDPLKRAVSGNAPGLAGRTGRRPAAPLAITAAAILIGCVIVTGVTEWMLIQLPWETWRDDRRVHEVSSSATGIALAGGMLVALVSSRLLVTRSSRVTWLLAGAAVSVAFAGLITRMPEPLPVELDLLAVTLRLLCCAIATGAAYLAGRGRPALRSCALLALGVAAAFGAYAC